MYIQGAAVTKFSIAVGVGYGVAFALLLYFCKAFFPSFVAAGLAAAIILPVGFVGLILIKVQGLATEDEINRNISSYLPLPLISMLNRTADGLYSLSMSQAFFAQFLAWCGAFGLFLLAYFILMATAKSLLRNVHSTGMHFADVSKQPDLLK